MDLGSPPRPLWAAALGRGDRDRGALVQAQPRRTKPECSIAISSRRTSVDRQGGIYITDFGSRPAGAHGGRRTRGRPVRYPDLHGAGRDGRGRHGDRTHRPLLAGPRALRAPRPGLLPSTIPISIHCSKCSGRRNPNRRRAALSASTPCSRPYPAPPRKDPAARPGSARAVFTALRSERAQSRRPLHPEPPWASRE